LAKKIHTSEVRVSGAEATAKETGDGILLRPAGLFPETTLDQVIGCLHSKGKSKTLAQMKAAIGREVIRRHARGRY
jgi:hypothetical protein